MSKIVTYLIQNQKLYKCIRSSECITLVPDLNLDMEELFLETITEINVNHFIYFKIYSNRIELVSKDNKTVYNFNFLEPMRNHNYFCDTFIYVYKTGDIRR